ncbi:MAG: Gfo/Idh/MocA family oxidoreductase, partial [Nitrososphaerota archaeon]|nr:Gfo/Idh/MocA family oxidoreductase [Nitrososphaerota archaeon]
MDRLKVGVVGTGGWGKNHLRVFNELGVLSCLCDIDQSRANQWSEKYDCKAYTDVDRMLEVERLDAVTICVPTSLHFAVASKVLKR